MKIFKNCEKKEIENEIYIIFSCNKYDNTRRKAFNDIKVDNIKDELSDLRQFLATESPLKMMNNAFYLISKALFILKIFKFCLNILVM